MGVRGLTTFIRNQEQKFLQDYKLHNCKVLLDGNSVVANLYIRSNIESAFGGDYDKFALYVKGFFKVLKKCEIRPLVVFDGGYEQKKLRTVHSRLKDRVKDNHVVLPFRGSHCFPLFMKIVFREVLKELNIPFAQSDFEADNELAALARQLQCPIISYDSDFYIYNVLYIPFPTVELHPKALSEPTEGSDKKYYLECKIYSVEVFVNSFGGLDKSMLPLLAALLGNDYIRRSAFKGFYTNMKIPKGKSNRLQRRIRGVIGWLKRETFDSAVMKILGRMKTSSRTRMLHQLEKIVRGYVHCSSVLSEYLELDSCSTSAVSQEENIVGVIEKISGNVENISDSTADELGEEWLQSDEDGFTGSSNEEFDSEVLEQKNSVDNEEQDFTQLNGVKFPEWIIRNARKGKIQSCVIDILSLKQYFIPPQVEDYSLSSTHAISLKLLQAIVGLLLGETESEVRYWSREGTRLKRCVVQPVYKSANVMFPPIDEIPNISESQRRTILLEVTGVNINLNQLPEDWLLFAIAILYWLQNMDQPVRSESHLHSLTMCLVTMFTVDSKVGVFRNKQVFTKKHKTYLSKVAQLKYKENLNLTNLNSEIDLEKDKDPSTSINEILDKVSFNDCILMCETFIPYHHSDEQIKVKPKLFCVNTVHAFSQFQSCLFHLIVLNSVLGFPFQEPSVYKLFSSTFVYNMFTNLSKRSNIDAYIEAVFQQAPKLLKLYKSVVEVLKNTLGDLDLKKNTVKVTKRKKKQPKQAVQLIEEFNSEEVETEDEQFFDGNNIFSVLSLIKTPDPISCNN